MLKHIHTIGSVSKAYYTAHLFVELEAIEMESIIWHIHAKEQIFCWYYNGTRAHECHQKSGICPTHSS